MQIKIYQINLDRDNDRLAFVSLDSLNRSGKTVNPEIYDKVFEGEVKCRDLEDVFQMFNLDHPEDYRGRSLSVSDVVAVRNPITGEDSFHFCDSVGFEEINFDESRTQAPAVNMIRVVLVEPGKPARLADVEPCLEGYYMAIGADIIQAVYPFKEEVCIVCDDEGKLNGSPLNRALRTEGTGEIYDIIAGTFFVCSCKNAEFSSLDQDQQKRYLDLYKWPERFFRIGNTMQAIEVKPAERGDAR